MGHNLCLNCFYDSLLTLSPEDVLPAVYLCTNKIAANHENIVSPLPLQSFSCSGVGDDFGLVVSYHNKEISLVTFCWFMQYK